MSTSRPIDSKSPTARALRPLTFAAFLCLFGSAPTWAAGSAPPSITVSFRDLDLSSVAGATTLYHRIQDAAQRVCQHAASDPIERTAWQACYRNATADDVRKVNSPLLTALSTGRPAEITAMLSK